MEADPASFAELSLEELSNIEITSVSKRPEKLSEAAAAIFVITREDIHRSGAASIPEALRMAPNLQVAQINSSQYAITARGFNTSTANKLLVLIDGRSVYTPLYSGVFWDVQDVLMEDIERIEVISGPGGTLWGSNAVNGVINIITRHTNDTQGKLVTLSAGNQDRGSAGFRLGGKLSDEGTYRIYAKHSEHDDTALANGASAFDSWRKSQAGFRTDWKKGNDSLTLQGDAYTGSIDSLLTRDALIEGANVLTRWQRKLASDSDLQIQFYYDHTKRDFTGNGNETRNTADIDFLHRFKPAEDHEIVWGGGYRASKDHVVNSPSFAIIPDEQQLDITNLFVQDSVTLIKNRLQLTVGSKFEHNGYTGMEIQPSIRLAWKPRERELAWAAISRAVRTPSRIDHDIFIPGSAPFLIAGGPNFESETLLAYELGYRIQPNARTSLSINTFYNVYKNIRTATLIPGTSTFVINNGEKGDTYGVELWGELALTDAWRLKAGYAFLQEDLQLADGSLSTGEANDAKHRFLLRSSTDLSSTVGLDWTLTHVSALTRFAVPAYTSLDMRVGWKVNKQLEISFIGRNLLDNQHPEFGTITNRSEIQRSGLVRATWQF